MELVDISTVSPWKAFLVSLAMGIIHVVMGPDHLSGLAVLVAGTKRRETENIARKCAIQGSRWGVGHTFGLGIMTTLFMCLRSSLPIEKISKASDTIVGISMMFIGSLSIYSSYRWYSKNKKEQLHLNGDMEANIKHTKDGIPIDVVPVSDAHNEVHKYNMCHNHSNDSQSIENKKTVWYKYRSKLFGETSSDNSRSAYFLGCIHGISGLSGVVYVLPVIFLNDTLRLLLYLGGFFMTSILSMTLLGYIVGIIPQKVKSLIIFSASAGVCAIGAGILFIFLTW